MKAYPLQWPTGWRRAASRKDAAFGKRVKRIQGPEFESITIADGADRVYVALEAFGVATDTVIISSNVKPTLSGRPTSGMADPQDTGVAVYWRGTKDTVHKVIAIDRYTRVADNLAAVAATLEAMRAIERHGGAVILERAFMGFDSLPSPNNWRDIMGYKPEAVVTVGMITARYRELAKSRHPDSGGSTESMAQLNWAKQEAEKELG